MKRLSVVMLWALAAVSSSAGCGGASTPGGSDDGPTSSVTHGSQVDETNTGVPAGHTLTDVTSTLVVTEDWIAGSNGGSRVLENLRFLSGASLIVTVDGFTVRYCKFLGTAGFSTDPNDGSGRLGKNVQILDSEFDGNHENFAGAVAVGGSNLTLDYTGAHIEDIYVAGGAHQTYLRSKLVSNGVRVDHGSAGSAGISASLAIYNESWATFTPLTDIRVEDSYFESDGYYPLYGGACVSKGNPYATDMVVTGNIFSRGGLGGSACCFDSDGAGNEWTDNTYTDGVVVPAPDPA